MKFSKLTILIGSVVLVTLVYSASKSSFSISEESMGFRKTTIYTEIDTIADKTMYSTSPAGTSKKFDRAYQNAPPMIPHNVEGLLPITINNNQCMTCHEPQMASMMGMGATAIPKSHYTDLRPKHTYDGENFIHATDHMKSELAIKPVEKLVGARFNCTLCHAPQSTGKLIIENTFEVNYSREDGALKSNFDDFILDNLDTSKKQEK